MQASYVSLRSSNLPFDHCDPMDMDQDDSYLKQSLLLGEPLSYIDTQNPYYDALQDLADQESVAHSARIPFHTYQTAAPCLDLGLPPNLFRGNGLRGSWRYNQTLGGGEQNFVPEFQPSPAQCLNQRIVYPTQAVFEESYKMTASSDAEAHKEDVASSSASPKIDSTSATEAWPLASEEPISGFHQDDDVLARDSPGDEETSGDKPYARLIHEALMQAPGHRMMLREIYDWFVQNTTKPSESGTNGWQNSIRHNLSMNQAFENDRTDPANPGHQARKANSVWILTDDAIKYGVQSTTRYRKHGSNKKTNRTRTPAPLRQRSGAKGGRAARRAAKLRREEQMNRQCSDPAPHNASPSEFYRLQVPDRTSQEVDHFSVASPLTPDSEPAFGFPQSSDVGPYYYHLPEFYALKSEPLTGQVEPPCDGELQPPADTCTKDLLSYRYDSPQQPVPR